MDHASKEEAIDAGDDKFKYILKCITVGGYTSSFNCENTSIMFDGKVYKFSEVSFNKIIHRAVDDLKDISPLATQCVTNISAFPLREDSLMPTSPMDLQVKSMVNKNRLITYKAATLSLLWKTSFDGVLKEQYLLCEVRNLFGFVTYYKVLRGCDRNEVTTFEKSFCHEDIFGVPDTTAHYTTWSTELTHVNNFLGRVNSYNGTLFDLYREYDDKMSYSGTRKTSAELLCLKGDSLGIFNNGYSHALEIYELKNDFNKLKDDVEGLQAWRALVNNTLEEMEDEMIYLKSVVKHIEKMDFFLIAKAEKDILKDSHSAAIYYTIRSIINITFITCCTIKDGGLDADLGGNYTGVLGKVGKAINIIGSKVPGFLSIIPQTFGYALRWIDKYYQMKCIDKFATSFVDPVEVSKFAQMVSIAIAISLKNEKLYLSNCTSSHFNNQNASYFKGFEEGTEYGPGRVLSSISSQYPPAELTHKPSRVEHEAKKAGVLDIHKLLCRQKVIKDNDLSLIAEIAKAKDISSYIINLIFAGAIEGGTAAQKAESIVKVLTSNKVVGETAMADVGQFLQPGILEYHGDYNIRKGCITVLGKIKTKSCETNKAKREWKENVDLEEKFVKVLTALLTQKLGMHHLSTLAQDVEGKLVDELCMSFVKEKSIKKFMKVQKKEFELDPSKIIMADDNHATNDTLESLKLCFNHAFGDANWEVIEVV